MNSPRMPKPPLTPDGAELELLSECIRLGGFMAFPLGAMSNVMMQLAHERLVKTERLRLIDISVVPNPMNKNQPEPARIFKITDDGKKRRIELLASAK